MVEPSEGVQVEARFNAILDQFGRYLRNTIVSLCPRDLGLLYSDIEQEARVRVWRALERGTEITDPASYLYRVAATVTIDAIRRVKARREEQLRVLEDEDDKGPAAEPVADPESSPDRLAERRQLIAKVQSVFGRIEEKRRRAIVLHLEGMNTHEIARALNWSEPKARHLVYRGLADLRRLLKAEGIDGEID
jgi:RNA polymerase sigma factor (sigma-70 family)